MFITVKKHTIISGRLNLKHNRGAPRSIPISPRAVALVLEHDGVVYHVMTHTGEVGYIFDTGNIMKIS